MFIIPCLLLQQTSASAKVTRQGADAPQSSQPKRKGTKGAKAGTKRQKVATPPPPPVSPILVESSPSSPDVQMQQAPSPQPMQEAPQMEEPQQEKPQSADVGEQTTGPVGPIISSAVLPIQTTVVLPPGNIPLTILLPMNLFSSSLITSVVFFQLISFHRQPQPINL